MKFESIGSFCALLFRKLRKHLALILIAVIFSVFYSHLIGPWFVLLVLLTLGTYYLANAISEHSKRGFKVIRPTTNKERALELIYGIEICAPIYWGLFLLHLLPIDSFLIYIAFFTPVLVIFLRPLIAVSTEIKSKALFWLVNSVIFVISFIIF